MAKLVGHHLQLHPPRGVGRAHLGPARRRARGASGSHGGAASFVAQPQPVVHLANFGLPEERGDFGSGAVELMGDRDVLIVLFEYEPEAAATALFKIRGHPCDRSPTNAFDPTMLRRGIAGSGRVPGRSSTKPGGRSASTSCSAAATGGAPLVQLVNSVLATRADRAAAAG